MDLLWTDFLNTQWRDWRGSGKTEDRLANPAALERFLAQSDLAAPVPPSPAELTALREFRDRLRRMAEVVMSGGALAEGDLSYLNAVLSAGPVVRQVTSTENGRRLSLNVTRQDWPQVMAEIGASFATTLTEGDGARIRTCANPDCGWFFYDDTRNRTKRFCDEKLCGNLMKVRRFRARHKTEP